MAHRLRATSVVALCLTAGLPQSPALAQSQVDSREGIALQNQILELRRDLNQLREQGGGSASNLGSTRTASPAAAPAANSDITAQLLERVSQLEEEVRRLRGRVDESANAHQQAEADLRKQIGDLNFKVGGSAAGGGATAGAAVAAASPPVAEPPPKPAATAPRTPELALQEGNAALARRDYSQAEQAAREVLSNPKTPRATDAQFLLAQAYYGQRQYAQAAVSYNDTYTRSRTGPRAQDSLLGLANSLIGIKEWVAACETLAKMHAEFPNLRNDLREAVASARQKASCK
jgi:TolA-binding protein